jgi:hypothetical protein
MTRAAQKWQPLFISSVLIRGFEITELKTFSQEIRMIE